MLIFVLLLLGAIGLGTAWLTTNDDEWLYALVLYGPTLLVLGVLWYFSGSRRNGSSADSRQTNSK